MKNIYDAVSGGIGKVEIAKPDVTAKPDIDEHCIYTACKYPKKQCAGLCKTEAAEVPEPVAWLSHDGGRMELCEQFTPDEETISEWCLLYGPDLLAAYHRVRVECDEQARLNGMGSEREARLMAQLAELREKHERLVARLREPSEEMVSAGYSVHPCKPGETKITDAFKAMSTVALRDSEGGE